MCYERISYSPTCLVYVQSILNECVFILPQAGRSSKRQLFLFPGGIERHVKIKTCSVSVGSSAPLMSLRRRLGYTCVCVDIIVFFRLPWR